MKHEITEMLGGIRPEFDFTVEADFIEQGMLDSFDVISLVAKLEEKYGVNIDIMEVLPENFSSVEAIAGLIERAGSGSRTQDVG